MVLLRSSGHTTLLLLLLVVLSEVHISLADDALSNVDEQGTEWLTVEQLSTTWKAGNIDRVESSISYEDFSKRFGKVNKPVIFSGALSNNPIIKWSWDDVETHGGDLKVNPWRAKKKIGDDKDCKLKPGEAECEMPEQSVSSLIREHILKSETASSGPFHSAYDISMEESMPQMFEHYRELKHFADNALEFFEDSTWPHVSLRPRGTFNELDTENMGTAVAIYLLKGHQQYLIFPPGDGGHLCRKANTGQFKIDAFRPDFSKGCVSALKASPTVAELHAGDVLYIPSSHIYAVRNLQSTMTAFKNFVDHFNYKALEESAVSEQWFLDLPSRDTLDMAWILDLIEVLKRTKFDPSEAINAESNLMKVTRSRELSRTILTDHLEKHKDESKINEGLAYFVAPGNTLEQFLKELDILDFLPELKRLKVDLLDVLLSYSNMESVENMDTAVEKWKPVVQFIMTRWSKLLERIGVPNIFEGMEEGDMPEGFDMDDLMKEEGFPNEPIGAGGDEAPFEPDHEL